MSATETHVDRPVAPTPSRGEKKKPSGVVALLTSNGARSSLTPLVFLLVFTYYGIWLGGTFLNVDARMLDVHQSVPVILVGLAVMVSLLGGHFDLSAAATTSLTTFLAIGLSTKNGMPFIASLVVCVLAGIIIGLVNGILVVRFRMNSFIATLGTSGAVLGISNVYSGGTQLVPDPTGRQLPGWFVGAGSMGSFQEKVPLAVTAIAVLVLVGLVLRGVIGHRPERFSVQAWYGTVTGIVIAAVVAYVALDGTTLLRSFSWTIAVLIVVAILLRITLRSTVFGRNLQATGSNSEAARLAGVKTDRTTVASFAIGGAIAAVAGVILAAGQGAASPDGAATFALPAFGAAFLSTVIFSNGRYTVPGSIAGGIFVVWVSQGLIVGGVPFTWSSIVNGVVLVAAVAISTASTRSR